MKKIKTIVMPTDFSRLSEAALDCATALAAQNDAQLLIVHVEEPALAAYADGQLGYGLPTSDQDALQEMLRNVRPTKPEVRYRHFWLKGDPAVQIAAFAQKENADLIVLSSHGRTGLSRLIMGSVAESVMRNADCPVLVVKSQVTANAVQAAESVP